MSYFKRREKIYASLDADRVDEATFTPESADSSLSGISSAKFA